MITPEAVAGWSALVAAVATVLGAVFLVLFFSRGQPWGTINDLASIVLTVAMIPVVLVVFALESGDFTTIALTFAALGLIGIVVTTTAQVLLVLGVRTYQQLLRYTLGGGAVIGLWYILAGAIGIRPLGQPLVALAIASGVGYIAIGYGFTVGDQKHPLSIVGGTVLLVASTAFLVGLGWSLLTGSISIVPWNQ